MPIKAQETKPLHTPFVQKHFFGVRTGRAMPAVCPTLSKISPSSKVYPIDQNKQGSGLPFHKDMLVGAPGKPQIRELGGQRKSSLAKPKTLR